MEAHDIEFSARDKVLKVLKGSMVILKGVRCNNIYYLKDNTITGKLTTSVGINDDLTRLWHMRLVHTCENFLQSLARKKIVEGCKYLQIGVL